MPGDGIRIAVTISREEGNIPLPWVVRYRDLLLEYADFGRHPDATFRQLAYDMTTRDAAMSLLNHPTRGAAKVRARDAMTREVVGCAPAATLTDVLALMATHHVRRLPVRDERGHVEGVISIDDIVIATGTAAGLPTPHQVVDALRRILSRPTAADTAALSRSGRTD